MSAGVPAFAGQSVAETFRNVSANLEFAAEAAPGFYGAAERPTTARIVAQVAELHGVTYGAALAALTGGAR